MQLFERFDVRAKADKKEQDQGLFADTQELNLGYQITDRWNVSTGARKDEREYTGRLFRSIASRVSAPTASCRSAMTRAHRGARTPSGRTRSRRARSGPTTIATAPAAPIA